MMIVRALSLVYRVYILVKRDCHGIVDSAWQIRDYDAISRLHISTCTQSATATDSSKGQGRSAALAQLFEAGM